MQFPTLQIKEQVLLPIAGGDGFVCEDENVVVARPGHYIYSVLDGVSGLEDIPELKRIAGHQTPARWIVRRLKYWLEQMPPPNSTAQQALAVLNEADQLAFAPFIKGELTLEPWRRPAAAAMVVVLDVAYNKFSAAQAADCICVVETTDGRRILLDHYRDDDEEIRILRESKRLGISGKPSADLRIREMLLELRRRRNDTRLAVLDGNFNPKLAGKWEMNLSTVSKFAIFTDGFVFPEEDPFAIGCLMLDFGPRTALHYILHREYEDPECEKWLRFKQSDDKTATVVHLRHI